MSYGLPSTVPRAADTTKPAGLSPSSFFRWKWDIQTLVSEVAERMVDPQHRGYHREQRTVFKSPGADRVDWCLIVITDADQDLRAYAARIPDHLVCRSAPLWRMTADIEAQTSTHKHHPTRLLSDYHQSTDLSDEGVPLVLTLQ